MTAKHTPSAADRIRFQGGLAFLASAMFLALAVSSAGATTVWLDELDLSLTSQSWAEPHKNQSVDGHVLSIGGQTFAHGLGTHCDSVLYLN